MDRLLQHKNFKSFLRASQQTHSDERSKLQPKKISEV